VFDPGSLHMRYMADNAALGKASFQCLYQSTNDPYSFHLNTPQLEVNLAKPRNLARSNDISDLGELGIGNSLLNVIRSLIIYSIFMMFSVFLGFRY
jgi:hypothetical protein